MGAVDSILAAALTKGFRGKRIAAFDPIRDIPGCFGWYDMSKLPGANDSVPVTIPDLSGAGNDLTQAIAAKRGTVKADGPNGNKYLNLSGTQFYQRPTAVAGFLTPAYPQPNILVFAFRAGSASAAQQNLTGGLVPGVRHNVLLNATNGSPSVAAGPSVSTGPHRPKLTDATWHILTCVLSATYWTTWLDGSMIGSGTTQAQGNEPFSGITLGAAVDGSTGLIGDLGEVLFISGRPPLPVLDRLHAILAAKWSVS